jgi:hypothetical protein
MSISVHDLATGTFVPKLRSLLGVLEKGAAFASARGLELSVLVEGRLAPDMYTLRQQVRLACYQVKDAVLRLTGREGTQPEDIGEAFADLEARVRATIDLVQGTPASAFQGAGERKIIIPIPGGGMFFEMTGEQFLRDWAVPHFYFHVVTAYDILRHLGVDIGKRDFMMGMREYMRSSS